jgi:hypothetical protein
MIPAIKYHEDCEMWEAIVGWTNGWDNKVRNVYRIFGTRSSEMFTWKTKGMCE